jgi:alpha/beta superfamily hydrolase
LFRGVDGSTGRVSWTGRPEENDAKTLIQHLISGKFSATVPAFTKVILCGYSYGAMTLCSCAADFPDSIECIVAISYPFGVSWFLSLFNTEHFVSRALCNDIAKLFIIGTLDQFTSIKSLEAMTNRADAKGQKTIEIVQDADHFWFNHEQKIVSLVLKYLKITIS